MKRPSTLLAAQLFWLLCACADSKPPASAASPVLGQTISIALPSDDGALVSIPFEAHSVVLDVWSPTCVPCRESVPALVKRAADLEAANAKLVLVAVLADDETTEGARERLASWGVRRPFLVDRGEVLLREANVTALPATLVISPGGEVRWIAPTDATVADIVNVVRSVR